LTPIWHGSRRRRAPVSRGKSGDTLDLKDKIRNRQARIGIIGLGYVGLPLAVEFAKAGFEVTGFDVDVAKIAAINKGQSYIGDVSSEDVSAASKAGCNDPTPR